jgi:hypothetical protein
MRNKPWSITLRVTGDGAKVEVTEAGDSLEEVLAEAWRKLDRTISKGLPMAALAAPIEATAAVAAAAIPDRAEADDEIPF